MTAASDANMLSGSPYPRRNTHMDRSEALARQFLDLTDRHDWAAREAILAPDSEFVTPFAVLRGPQAATAFSEPFLSAFPDSRHLVEVVVASDDVAVVEGTWIGTHTNPLPTPDGDVSATGKVINLPFAMVIRVQGELIASEHIYLDQLGFLAQLGLVPAPQAA